MPIMGVGAVLIDMNGNVVKQWKDLQGFPNKLLPGGQVFGHLGVESKTDSGNTLILCHETLYNTKISDKRLLDDCFIEVDFEGNIIWDGRETNISAIISKETGKVVW